VQWEGESLFPVVEPPKFDAKHISLTAAEIKNIWNF
jgi:hypothetical protein